MLFFCLINKAAGIYHNNVMIRLPLMHYINFGGFQLPAQHFTVNKIFAAAQCYNIHLVFL